MALISSTPQLLGIFVFFHAVLLAYGRYGPKLGHGKWMEDGPLTSSGRTSSSNQFQCKTGGKNITSQLKCDGKADCEDGSDEGDCHKKGKSSWVPCEFCFEDQYQCYSSGKCIPSIWTCDDIYDCDDGSDEYCNWYGNEYKMREPPVGKAGNKHLDQNSECWVPVTYCPPNHFRCYWTGKCIPAFWECDGIVDCSDYSDEESCFLHNAQVGKKRRH